MTLTRRGVFGAALGALGGVPRAAEAGRVLDAHVHFYDPTRPQGVPWPSKDETLLYQPTYPERYLARIRPERVDGVIAVEASPWLDDNRWLLDVADRSRLVWGVVGSIRPGSADFREALDRFAGHKLFRGIRINAASVATVLAEPEALSHLELLGARDLSLDILLDRAERFGEIARLAAALPDLRLILGHLPLDGPRDEGFRALGRARSVYAKVSGVLRRRNGRVVSDAGFYKPALDELWSTFGAERLIYASNWPVCELMAPYPVVFGVVREYAGQKEAGTIENFFWKNAARAYRCGER